MFGVPKRQKDLLLVKGPTDDGGGVHVVRARPERVEMGTMRPLVEGRPIDGEVVRVNPHPKWPCLYEVETELALPSPGAAAEPASEPKPVAPQAAKTLESVALARAGGLPQVA